MKSLFESRRPPEALLAPLGGRRRLPRLIPRAMGDLPPAAAPIAVTLAGGVALVLVLGAFLSRQPAPEPQHTAAAVEQPAPAMQTAAPPPPPAEETVAEPSPQPARAAAPDTGTAAPLPRLAPTATPDLTPPPVSEPDLERTASIPRVTLETGTPGSPVPIAETEEELLALEAIQMNEVEADLSSPSDEATSAIAPSDTVPMRAATTTRYVNMRAGPDDDAEVLTVVPALAEIRAEAECGWCAVAYDGRTGFIYQSFISYAD